MIGKWNKSVILTYIGLAFSITGIRILTDCYPVKYAIVCLIFAGVCDLFDGTIARKIKRTEEEKKFGVEIDSLVDVISFITFPLILVLTISERNAIYIPVYVLFSIFGVARLAHFNITTENTNKPRKYYEGLPVTYTALIYPLFYLLSYVLEKQVFRFSLIGVTLITGILFILKIKIPKPKLKASLFLLLLSIILSIIYLFIL